MDGKWGAGGPISKVAMVGRLEMLVRGGLTDSNRGVRIFGRRDLPLGAPVPKEFWRRPEESGCRRPGPQVPKESGGL